MLTPLQENAKQTNKELARRLHIAVAGNDELSGFVLDRPTQRTEIVDVRTSVIFDHFRRAVVTPAS
ncbi:hypothetical protein [Amycolatopsis sp. NPDC049159]|uniref:hypothetical protein n=1 Tax=Amycolatopsis sp. NPDC049159 TaxID=3157210 RepID=UPI0033D0DD4C